MHARTHFAILLQTFLGSFQIKEEFCFALIFQATTISATLEHLIPAS